MTRASQGKRSCFDPEWWLDNARHGPHTQHFRIDAEEAGPMLVRCADRSLWPVRHRSAGGFVVRRSDQLHDGFETQALSDRGEPASARAYRLARKTGRSSVCQDSVPDLRDFAFRAGWPPYRTDARRLSRLRRFLSAHDCQPDADATRGRHRAEGTAAGTRLPLGENVGMQTLGASRYRPDRV